MTDSLTLEIRDSNIAYLTFDLVGEKVNKLSAPVLSDLENKLEEIKSNPDIKALVIKSNKKGIFIAGADINEIKEIKEVPEAKEKVSRGQQILHKISELDIPSIAVINGACLGGGLELALACTYRIVTPNPKTSLGLPEVNLGIIPGFGGCIRLPALVGLQESLKIILSGKPIKAKKALKIGLADQMLSEEFLEEGLDSFLKDAVNKNNKYLTKRKKAKSKRSIFEDVFLGRIIVHKFAKRDLLNKTKGQYPAPLYALEVIRRTYGSRINKGLKIELEAFCELVIGDISKNLIEIFFINEELKKDSGVDKDVEVKEINKATLVGAGVMGGGIAWIFSKNDIQIRIKDITQEAIALGYKQIAKIYNQLKKIRKITPAQISLKMSKVSSGLDYTSFDQTDIVVEAVVENMDIKKKILSELQDQVKDDAIIVSNTSSLSITEMSQALDNPQRFAGMHFFNPVNRMPLVEVIKGEKTSDETVASVVKLTKKLGKTPIVVKDVPGFLVNRILLPYMNEAAYLLQEGANIVFVDRLIEEFGMPMGPFILADIVGIDVGAKVANSLFEGYGDRMRVADILDELYDNHKELLGKKSGTGFYLHNADDRVKPQVNSQIYNIINALKEQKEITKTKASKTDIVDRCILTMVNEAAKCLEEGVVKNARHLDMAMIMGTGFPAFRGGVLRYADSLGLKEVVSKLQDLEKAHGKRFEVSKLLIQMSEQEKTFY